MKYPSGELIHVGDEVDLGGGQNGTVVGIIEEGSYLHGYNKEDWAYLSTGLIVQTEFGDLRLEEPDEDLELRARAEYRYRTG